MGASYPETLWLETLKGLFAAPAPQFFFQRIEAREFRNDVGNVPQQVFHAGNLAPGGHGKKFKDAVGFDPHLAVPLQKTLAQDGAKFLEVGRRRHVVTPDPGNPLRDLRLMTES